MVAQVVLSSEGLVADVALVWAFVGVCSLVDEQVVRLGEVATAEATDELLAAARSRLGGSGGSGNWRGAVLQKSGMRERKRVVSQHLLLLVDELRPVL